MNKNQIINSIFYPRKSNIPQDSNDQLIETDDGNQVGVRYFLKSKNLPNIIFFHGNAELAQEYNDIGSFYNQYDMNFIVCDYRGYGLSTGNPSKENLLLDAIKVFEHINVFLKSNQYSSKTIVMGRSLGSASACEIINKCEENIDACIIESGFATEYPLLQLLQIDPENIDYKIEDGFMNLSKIKKFKKPLFIIHADLDDIIPFSQAEIMLLESKSSNKDLFKVSGANHNNIILISREEYFKKIRNFIKKI